MKSYVALVRGINVGGKAMVAMADLQAFFEADGFSEVKTLLQSGNVVFKAKAASAAALEKQLEKAAEKTFGRALDFFVRDGAAWSAVVKGNPFQREAQEDPSHLLVLFLKDQLTKASVAALQAAIVGREYVRAGDRCLYLVYPDGIGESKLTNAVMDRKLGMSGTGRNWNTVIKLAGLVE
jgi:uncharacterized protein (DUF1697 family)